MESLINAWGGEGVLTSASLFVMGSLGMFRGLLGDNEKIHIRVLDLEDKSPDYKRTIKLAELYKKYYTIMFNAAPEIVLDNVTISDIVTSSSATSVFGKYVRKDLLSLGCSQSDMILDIDSGIYGKPWLGEVFYSDANFNKLYENIPHGTEVIIVNCGGYRGGGTATTFIPLENSFPPKGLIVHRYTVVAGPGTKFTYTVKVPYPDIYSTKIPGINGVDIFEIQELKQRLLSYNIELKNFEKHQQNLRKLDEEWDRVNSSDFDFTNLNPRYYAPRFLDRLYSDVSEVSAVFINIKTDGTEILDYDITSHSYQPNEQRHKLHISNLINVLSIREIINNNESYRNGQVYSFGTSCGNDYTPSTIFTRECYLVYWRFIIMVMIITYYVHDCFLSVKMPRTNFSKQSANDDKSRKTSGLFSTFQSTADRIMASFKDDKLTRDYIENADFYKAVLKYINQFLSDFVVNILNAIIEIDETSDQANMFLGITKDIINYTINCISLPEKVHSEHNDLNEYIVELLTDLLQPLSNTQRDQIQTDIIKYFKVYTDSFPLAENANQMDAEKYYIEIIRYTMQNTEGLLGVI